MFSAVCPVSTAVRSSGPAARRSKLAARNWNWVGWTARNATSSATASRVGSYWFRSSTRNRRPWRAAPAYLPSVGVSGVKAVAVTSTPATGEARNRSMIAAGSSQGAPPAGRRHDGELGADGQHVITQPRELAEGHPVTHRNGKKANERGVGIA